MRLLVFPFPYLRLNGVPGEYTKTKTSLLCTKKNIYIIGRVGNRKGIERNGDKERNLLVMIYSTELEWTRQGQEPSNCSVDVDKTIGTRKTLIDTPKKAMINTKYQTRAQRADT